MNKIFIVLLFILLGSSLIVINNIKGTTENSFNIVYENNKNLALPDLTNKSEIIDGLYRFYDGYGIVIDYNVYNGSWLINGETEQNDLIIYINYNRIEYNGFMTHKYYYVSGQITNNIITTGVSGSLINIEINISNYTNNMQSISNEPDFFGYLILYIPNQNTIFNNLKFKLQLEKGSQPTSYVVPKLIPHYQDNLSLEEKEKIGFGAFGGVTQIIKTINDIIKPVGDFINGILSWF